MKRYSKTKILLASFFIFYVPVFFGLFECYCLSDADLLGSPSFERPDLLSMPSCSQGRNKFFVFIADHDLLSLLDNNIFFNHLRATLLQIPSIYLLTSVLRC